MMSICPVTTRITAQLLRFASRSAANLNQPAKELRREAPFDESEIPMRIERGPTDILKALASTVHTDYTAAHYKFHDDPYFTPTSNALKRNFSLSKESGRKAARWIRDEYPICFGRNHAAPNVEAFLSQPKYDETSDVCSATLNNCIEKCRVTDAITVYNLLKSKGIEVDEQTKQSLFELLSFYNCENPIDDDLTEERWFRQSSKEARKIWSDNSLAETLYKEFDTNDVRSQNTMIRGLAKYFRGERAWKLYEAVRQNGVPVHVSTYNALLKAAAHIKENSESRWQLMEELLTSMHREGIAPNLGTFNSTLETISRMGSFRDAKNLALRTLAEMKQLGIDPSLASYYYLLSLFCRERGPVSTILFDIMRVLKGKELEVRDERDMSFFVTAMEVCHTHLQDKNLAFEVDALLNTGNNYNLIGDSLRESIYYQHFFKLLCATEHVDSFFEFYNKLVPQIYTPEPSVMLEILNAVELSGALHYIPQLWSDMVAFDQSGRENLVDRMLGIVANSKADDELIKQFAVIAYDIKKRIDSQPDNRINVVRWTGPMLGNVMLACLNAGEYDKACEVLDKCVLDQTSVAAPLQVHQLQAFAKSAMERNDLGRATDCAKLAYSIGYTEAAAIAREILAKPESEAKHRSTLEQIACMAPEEKQVV